METTSRIEGAATAAGTTVQRVQHYLENIAAGQHLNLFPETFDQEALQQAAVADQQLAAGQGGKLAGMVIGLKDVLCYDQHTLQASSNILKGFKSQFTATAVQRLINEGAVIIGRQSCDEFAMGGSNENSAYGPARNALDPARVPGGSSGASASAVAANMCQASIGSDTGGSVRQPAAFCGVVGLKPTYSRISRFGLVAYASSFDCIGPMGHTVEDCARLLEVMAGPDDFDSTVSHEPVQPYSQMLQAPEKLRIAVMREGLENPAVQPEIRAQLQTAIERLRKAGHEVDLFSFDLIDYILPTYYILTTAEASSNLSRYDGVRYGHRSASATDLESLYKLTRTEGFGEEVKRRIMLGTFVLSADYYDAYFTKAQRVRRLIKQATDKLLGHYDLLLTPTTPTTAFKIGEKNQDPISMYLGDIFTVQANVCGIPAMSVPAGKDHQGLPIGLQYMAGQFQEAKMLAAGKQLMELMAD